MKQISFAQQEFAAKKKVTRREKFLGEMEQVVPWDRLLQALEPYYFPNAGGKKGGRPPIGLERMLRIYFLQQWYGLADEALEDAIYDSQALREFVGIDLGRESVPDATTLLKFRRLLERHELMQTIMETINATLVDKGLLMRKGTIVDATILAAPPSTKNRDKARDPEMRQTRKGKQYYFGMKAHIGVDVHSGLVHGLVGTAANESDVKHGASVLHGEESHVHGDAGYTGLENYGDLKEREVELHIAAKRKTFQAIEDDELRELTKDLERLKASVRSRVEHPFHVVKNLFQHRKVRYRGLAKNVAQLFTLFGLANLVIVKKRLLVSCAPVAS